MKHIFAFVFFIFLLLSSLVSANLVANHDSVMHFNDIPQYWIDKAKTDFRIGYSHTSHGQQAISGMMRIDAVTPLSISFISNTNYQQNPTRYVSQGGVDYCTNDLSLFTNSNIFLHNYFHCLGDVGQYPDWPTYVRDAVLKSSRNRNVYMIGFGCELSSACGDGSSLITSEAELYSKYLNPMQALEDDYPTIQFIYTTGHMDGTGSTGRLHQMNELIRQYAQDNDKILFDYTDIARYDPLGNDYLDLGAGQLYLSQPAPYGSNFGDECVFGGDPLNNDWCADYCASHNNPLYCDNLAGCDHNPAGFICRQKGLGLWYLLALMAGWNGDPACVSETNCPGAPSCVDGDSDGYYVISVTCPSGTDCDDTTGSIRPGLSDGVCNGVDNDCDGFVDEDYVPVTSCFLPGQCSLSNVASSCSSGVVTACSTGTPVSEICGNSVDENCNGVNEPCIPVCVDSDSDGYFAIDALNCPTGNDCDDNNDHINPGMTDRRCDGVDEDCNGVADEDYVPSTGCYLYGVCAPYNTISSCTAGVETLCRTGTPVKETCGNGIDEDCDGVDKPCGGYPTQQLVFEDFEDGSWSDTLDRTFNPANVNLTSEPGINGPSIGAISSRMYGGYLGARYDYYFKNHGLANTTDGDKYYIRYYVYYEPSIVWNQVSATGWKQFRSVPPDGWPLFMMKHGEADGVPGYAQYTHTYYESLNLGIPTRLSTPYEPSVNEWHLFEIYLSYGINEGGYSWYIDEDLFAGVPHDEHSYTNWPRNTGTAVHYVDGFWLGGGNGPIPQSVYYLDNIEIWHGWPANTGEECGNGICTAAEEGVCALDCLGLPPICTDADNDGYNVSSAGCGLADCRDSNPNIFPGAVEQCGNGVDEDCSGSDLACPVGDLDGNGVVNLRDLDAVLTLRDLLVLGRALLS